MGIDLYDVKVRSTNERRVRLELRGASPDAPAVPASASFALMLLREPAEPGAPLASAMSPEDALDAAWMRKHAAGFVEHVAVVEAKPSKKSSAPIVLEVAVTHAAWLTHLKEGATWSSRAFEVTTTHDPCAPITPESASDDAAAPGDEPGFLPVPTACWLDLGIPAGAPRVVQIPAYTATAYIVRDSQPMTAELVRAWNGRAVQYQSGQSGALGRPENGVLLADGEKLCLLSLDANGKKQTRGEIRRKATVGLLELKPNAKLGSKLRFARVMAEVRAEVVSVRREGATATFSLRLSPDGHLPTLDTETEVLRIVATPLLGEHGDAIVGDAPLARALRDDLERRELDLDGLFPAVAKGYVASFTVRAPDEPELPDLDLATPAELRAIFAAAPIAELEVTMTDPRWLDHLDSIVPFGVDEHGFDAPEDWTDPPRRFEG
jgi:hypothetical protein